MTPAVRRLLREHGLDAAQIVGTGGGGRITREDVLAFVEAVRTGGPAPRPAQPGTRAAGPGRRARPPPRGHRAGRPSPAAPAADRRRASRSPPARTRSWCR